MPVFKNKRKEMALRFNLFAQQQDQEREDNIAGNQDTNIEVKEQERREDFAPSFPNDGSYYWGGYYRFYSGFRDAQQQIPQAMAIGIRVIRFPEFL